MAEDFSPSISSDTRPRGRGRGRGKSRGGLGKYLRARGRGHAYGRPAEFTQRLVLEGEAPTDLDSEEAEAIRQQYAKRALVSNADRYAEEEPELDSDGEAIQESEVDLSAFLERQRLSDAPAPPLYGASEEEDAEEEIDHSLAHITSQRQPVRPQKGRVQTIEWDATLEQLRREKEAADAHRDLKERFRAKTSTLRAKPMAPKERKKGAGFMHAFAKPRRAERFEENDVLEAPPLPTEDATRKDAKTEMQDFLDDLLG